MSDLLFGPYTPIISAGDPKPFIGSYAPITPAGEIGPFWVNSYFLQPNRRAEIAGPVPVRSNSKINKNNNK